MTRQLLKHFRTKRKPTDLCIQKKPIFNKGYHAKYEILKHRSGKRINRSERSSNRNIL